MANPVGRPTKYDPSFVDKVEEYLETTGMNNMKLPSLQGLAVFLKVDSDTLNNWANTKVKDETGKETNQLQYPEFFGALKNLKEVQAEQLINDGIYGGNQVNATIVKLMLQNNHGMKERVDATSNDKELKGLVEIRYDKEEPKPE